MFMDTIILRIMTVKSSINHVTQMPKNTVHVQVQVLTVHAHFGEDVRAPLYVEEVVPGRNSIFDEKVLISVILFK